MKLLAKFIANLMLLFTVLAQTDQFQQPQVVFSDLFRLIMPFTISIIVRMDHLKLLTDATVTGWLNHVSSHQLIDSGVNLNLEFTQKQFSLILIFGLQYFDL